MAVSVKSIKFAAKERKRVMMYFFTPGSEFLFALLGLGIVVWLIGAGGKNLFNSTTGHLSFPESCRAIPDDKCEYYTLIHDGDNIKHEMAFVKSGSPGNYVNSFWIHKCGTHKGSFEALITHRDFAPGRVLEEENVRASSIDQLAKTIEEKFKAWDMKYHHQHFWK